MFTNVSANEGLVRNKLVPFRVFSNFEFPLVVDTTKFDSHLPVNFVTPSCPDGYGTAIAGPGGSGRPKAPSRGCVDGIRALCTRRIRAAPREKSRHGRPKGRPHRLVELGSSTRCLADTDVPDSLPSGTGIGRYDTCIHVAVSGYVDVRHSWAVSSATMPKRSLRRRLL